MITWIWDEVNIDQFHEKGDRICSVFVNMGNSEQINTWTNTPYPLVDVLKTKYPEIEAVSMRGYTSDLFNDGELNFREYGYHIDPDFFDIFSIPFLYGNPAAAFNNPQSIVVSQELAEKLVGIGQAKNALGLQVKLCLLYTSPSPRD